MAREIYVIGNWKMYKTGHEATDYIDELDSALQKVKTHIYLAVPFTSIATVARLVKKSKVVVGAQNMNDAEEGAFTGEIAAVMLKEAGAKFVILGHSERRRMFGETDDFIHKKIIRALKENLTPILCVGEDLEERDAGRTEEVLRQQIEKCLESIPAEEAKKVILAYEPVWAIGTGKRASAEIAQKAHLFCRACLDSLFGSELSNEIPIVYGGSVKPDGVEDLIKQPDIDGVLVGGASLDPKTFSEIVLNCESVK